ncbi:hypothetical protein [Nocardioides alcanivorans]|uniref:hypothetical protein n=1 Tax=Nocardioides alcanivorans TaxID=2897352 RepID=UPI001F1CAA07|nr:hypothetical protein [Nocardioides alcanivorans]
MRGVVGWVLAGVLVLSACSGDDGTPDDGATPTPVASSSGEGLGAPTPTPAPPPEPVTTSEFCELVRDVTGDDGAARTRAAFTILQRGLPEDLDGDAKQGLQVLLDHASELGSVSDSVRLYRDLDKQERADLRSFTWWVTKSCGKGYIADLLPDLPEAPDWLKDPKLPSLR